MANNDGGAGGGRRDRISNDPNWAMRDFVAPNGEDGSDVSSDSSISERESDRERPPSDSGTHSSEIMDVSLCEINSADRSCDVQHRAAVRSDVVVDIDYTPPHYPKQPAEIRQLVEFMKSSFMFSVLSEEEMMNLATAFRFQEFESGTVVIKENDLNGEDMYLVERGEFQVYKQKDDEEIQVHAFEKGGVFGELALLYNCPRTATVKTAEGGAAWCLDRRTWTNLVQAAAMRKRERYANSIARVPILKDLNTEEIMKLVDALQPQSFPAGSTIITQGELGDKFYILESGRVQALVDGTNVLDYEPNDYFGELALLNRAPRAATIRVTDDGPAHCLIMDKAAFNRLMGSLKNLMKERQYVDARSHLTPSRGQDDSSDHQRTHDTQGGDSVSTRPSTYYRR